jgi:hypothetical protein
MLNFQTVLTGPLCFYTDFIKFIDGQNLEFKEVSDFCYSKF